LITVVIHDQGEMMCVQSDNYQMGIWLIVLCKIWACITIVNPFVVPQSTTRNCYDSYVSTIEIQQPQKGLCRSQYRHQKKYFAQRFDDSIEISKLCQPFTSSTYSSRRHWIATCIKLTTIQQLTMGLSKPVIAKADCYTDCFKNCKILAPKDDIYCKESCTEYCNQDDREDGLSGSISSEKGEVGILGGSFGTGTVVKGQDRPPMFGRIPGLDFTSESGKKMIGY
jgi:hypothetical protein